MSRYIVDGKPSDCQHCDWRNPMWGTTDGSYGYEAYRHAAEAHEGHCDMCNRPTRDGSALCFACGEDILQQLSDWDDE